MQTIPKRGRILVTGGRAPSTLDLVRDLRATGWDVLVGECRAWTVSAASKGVREVRLPPPQVDLEEFLGVLTDVCVREEVDVLQPTCEEVLSIAKGADRLPARTRLRASGFDRLESWHHKGRFIEACASAGLAVPRTQEARPGMRIDSRCIAKPVWSRSGARTRRVEAGSVFPDETGWILQEELVGREVCTTTVCRAGEVVAHAAYRPVLRRGYGPSWGFVSVDPESSLDWVRRLVAHQGCDGLVGFDLMDTDRGLIPMECNPRGTSGLHFLRGTGWTDPYLGDGALPRIPILAPAGRRVALAAAAPFLVPPDLVRSPRRVFRTLGFLLRSRDPVFDRKDPWPTLHQIPSAVSFFALSRQLGISAEAAVSWDLEWDPSVAKPLRNGGGR